MADDAKDQLSAADEWYLYHPSDSGVQLQPYRSAQTVWPLSAEELSRTESQAQSGNASALNNLGTIKTGCSWLASAVIITCAAVCVDRGDAPFRLGRATGQPLQSL